MANATEHKKSGIGLIIIIGSVVVLSIGIYLLFSHTKTSAQTPAGLGGNGTAPAAPDVPKGNIPIVQQQINALITSPDFATWRSQNLYGVGHTKPYVTQETAKKLIFNQACALLNATGSAGNYLNYTYNGLAALYK